MDVKTLDQKPKQGPGGHTPTAFVGGLPVDVTREQINTHMAQFGTVVTVDLKADNNGRCKGFAFVKFLEYEHVEAAVSYGATYSGATYSGAAAVPGTPPPA